MSNNRELIQVTYKIRSTKPLDPIKKAEGIAWGQTTDTWTPTRRSGLKKLQEHRGVVLEAKEISSPAVTPADRKPGTRDVLENASGFRLTDCRNDDKTFEYLLTIGFPAANTEGDIPSLLTMIFGKISLDGEIRLEQIEFPSVYLKGKGPRLGVEGIREKVGEPVKPLTMAIFKPCVGLTPQELGAMFLELAMGGMQLVKDDEILPDLPICPMEKRLEACLNAGVKAQKVTGHPTLYAINLTGTPSQIIPKAKRLARQGAQCFLLNVLSYGYGVLEELRGLGVPIMAHPALAGALCGSPYTGMSYRVVLGSLMRLGGADIVLFPSSYGTVALPQTQTEAITAALTKPMGKTLRHSFPGPSAGIHPGLVPRILQDYGNDVIINAGGGVHGHPQGARAGARAFQQAVDGALKGQDFKTLPHKETPELSKALELWGTA